MSGPIPPPVTYPVIYTHRGDFRVVASSLPYLWGYGDFSIARNLTVSGDATVTGTLTAGAIVAPGITTPICSVAKTAVQSIPDSTATTLTSWSAAATGLYTTAPFNTTTGICTVTETDKFPITATVVWSNSSNAGSREIRVLINGATTFSVKADNQPNSDITLNYTQVLTTKLALTAGDTIQIQVYQNTGGALNVNAGTGLVIG